MTDPDEHAGTIVEINRDSKYVIIVPDWFSSANSGELHRQLADFMGDPNKIFFVLSSGFELRKVD